MWDLVRDFADIFAKSSFLSYLHVSDAIIISKVHGKGCLLQISPLILSEFKWIGNFHSPWNHKKT